MLFNSIQFAVFFAWVWVSIRLLPKSARGAALLLLSLVFYGMWIPVFLVLLGATIVVNYGLLRAMVRSSRPRLFLALSVLFTLGLLGFFKYAAFAVESALPILRWGFQWSPAVPDVLLPLGISFYSFQILALAVDTYRGRVEPVERLGRYALFVCFFPQLIAGPIMRGSELLPQLEVSGAVTPERTRRGVWLIASGLAKKAILADFLLAGFVDTVFATAGEANAPYHLVAAYSFAFQIYFDFSGYTDIARGVALLLGFELPLNFAEPYLARNPAEFWRRWHITLSSWLRDYLYIPLGGNRGTVFRTVVNLFITMLLGGLWHGASWTFVVWGGLHGVLLAGHRLLVRRRRGGETDSLQGADWLKALILFHAVALLLVIFRSASISESWLFLTRVFTGSYVDLWPVDQLSVVVLCAALHVAERYARLHAAQWQSAVARAAWGPVAEGFALGAIVALALVVAGGGEFIYFQF